MDYNALEVELVGVLNGYFTDQGIDDKFLARLFPENQVDLLQDYEKAGLVNVLYSESRYDRPESTAEIVQVEYPIVGCYFQASKVRGADGVNALVTHTIRALQGYKPTNGRTRMWIEGTAQWKLNIEDGEVKPMVEFSYGTVSNQGVDNPLTETIDSVDTITEGGDLVSVESELWEDV